MVSKSQKKYTVKRRPTFKLKKGGLIKHGYSLKQNKTIRQKALKKASKEFSYGTMIRKLNVLAILHKNTNKIYSGRAKRDMEFIRKTRKHK